MLLPYRLLKPMIPLLAVVSPFAVPLDHVQRTANLYQFVAKLLSHKHNSEGVTPGYQLLLTHLV